jgi:Ca2+-binding RTX toxin-like protein
MVFALTSGKSASTAKAEKSSLEDLLRDFEAWLVANPSWLEDKGFGGIQAQVITSSTTFPDLAFSNPGKARGFDYWHETIANAGTGSVASSAPLVAEAVVSKPATGGLDPVPSDFVPARCMPIYWEEKVSEPVDVFDKDGIKTGYKIVTTGAGYTTTNTYDLSGLLISTDYESVFGDFSRTEYETIPSGDVGSLIRATTTGKNGAQTWSSLELRDNNDNVIESKFESSDGYTSSMKQSFDSQNNLLESSYESSDGSKSHTKQIFQKAVDGQLEKIIVATEGSGPGYNYKSYSEYDASWNLLSSTYSDGNGYSSSTARTVSVDERGVVQGYSVVSEGSGHHNYWYKSTETLDTNGNLIVSSYEDSSGYFSKRTTERLSDSQWGELIVARDSSGYANDFGKSIYTSIIKYTLDWRTIESENEDSYGNSGKLSTTVKTHAAGEKIYVQTYQYKYADGATSEWTTEYNDQWQPLVDGKPVEILPILYKQPRDAQVLEPETVPTIAKTAADEFQARPTTSASDIVSEQVVMGIEGKTDRLIGSDGNDVFMVNDSGDRIATGQQGDSDSVMAEKFGLSLLQKKWDGIENAMLVGSDDLNLTGDAGPNTLSGNGGDNVIRGGAGLDTLFGGGGKDVFVIAREKKSIDQVLDFESGEDKIALSGSMFKSLFDKKKQLKDGVIGEKLMLDEAGVLWFDVDGSGRKVAAEIAVIGVQETIDRADFIFMA